MYAPAGGRAVSVAPLCGRIRTRAAACSRPGIPMQSSSCSHFVASQTTLQVQNLTRTIGPKASQAIFQTTIGGYFHTCKLYICSRRRRSRSHHRLCPSIGARPLSNCHTSDCGVTRHITRMMIAVGFTVHLKHSWTVYWCTIQGV